MNTSALEQQQEYALKRMKRIPLLLLLLMVILWLAHEYMLTHYLGSGAVIAFSEAAIVGALADWFAVTALFRHPMGLPIPHTAIIPRRKNAIGANLAQFVVHNFLTPNVIRERLTHSNMSLQLALWLREDNNQRTLVRNISGLGSWFLNSLQDEHIAKFLERNLTTMLGRMNIAPLLSKLLALLTDKGQHQLLLTELARRAVVFLNENKTAIQQGIKQGNPWWVPGFIDDKIYEKMVARIENQLVSIALDPDHPARRSLDTYAQQLIVDLQHSSEISDWCEGIKTDVLNNETISHSIHQMGKGIQDLLSEQLSDETSILQTECRHVLSTITEELEKDPATQFALNRQLIDIICLFAEIHAQSIASLIADTVTSWDGEATSKRIELQIGRDLQFIRINGTLVGGIAGVSLYCIKLLLD